MVIYTSNLVPSSHAAITLGPFILIKPEYRGDLGLLEHEKVHVKQFYKYFPVFPLMYLVSKKFRLKVELEAYKKQLEYSPNSKDRFAEFLATKYSLDISKEHAYDLL